MTRPATGRHGRLLAAAGAAQLAPAVLWPGPPWSRRERAPALTNLVEELGHGRRRCRRHAEVVPDEGVRARCRSGWHGWGAGGVRGCGQSRGGRPAARGMEWWGCSCMPAWPRAARAESLARVWMKEHAELERLGLRRRDLHGGTQRGGARATSGVAHLSAAQVGVGMYLRAPKSCATQRATPSTLTLRSSTLVSTRSRTLY